MLKLALSIMSLVMASAFANAEEPRPDPLEANIVRQWQAAQTGQQNVGDALSNLLEAYDKEKKRADAAEAKLKDPK